MKLWILLTILFVTQSVASQNSEVEILVTDLAKNFSKAFKELKKFLNAEDIASKIKTKPKQITETEALQILTKSKKDTENLVLKASEVVDRIQSRVTDEYAEFSKSGPVPYNIDCGMTNYFFYFRSKAIRNGPYELQNCSSQNLTFTSDSLLGNVKTNRQNSTVHIPTNVFDSSKEIQNVANYTENVDKSFALSENKHYIKWQFFCSNTGFFKIFPGIRWHIQIEDMEKDNTKVDFYDCRSEQWFLESTSYPKKMIIMVDKSGSMKGRRRIIANHTIYEILNTITENDFFNVILFTKEHLFADNKTTDILMQATEKNKKFIMEQLELCFIPDGIAEYDVGLKASFKVLQNEKNQEVDNSTIYNYLVMIITDGSPQAYQEVIDEENKNVQARIFTYLIGQASTERDVVKQMACKNKGYAVEIATLADVKENVQKYLNVIARPNAIMQNTFHVWTGVSQFQMRPSLDQSVYAPTIVSQQQLGLSQTFSFGTNISQVTTSPLMTTISYQNVTIAPPPPPQKIEMSKPEPIQMFVTVSKAAYDVTNATAQKNIGVLLGAAGVDVPISDFVKTVPFWKIGVNAYMFGVTHNGFVLFHPRFRPQDKKNIKYFYRNVDISELEITVDEVITEIFPNQTIPSTLRDKILAIPPVDTPQYLESRSTYDIVDDFKTAFKTQRNYYIAGIQGTSYKFGLAIPVNALVPEYNSLKPFTEMELSVFLLEPKNNISETCNASYIVANQGGVALKEYEFCHLNKEIAALLIDGPLCLLREVITKEELRKTCLQPLGVGDKQDQTLELYLQSLYNEAENTRQLPSEWSSKASQASNVGAQQIFSMHHFGLIRYYNYKNLSYEQFIPDHKAAIEDPMFQETVLTSQTINNPKVLVVRPLPNNVVKKTADKNILVFTVTAPLVTGQEYKGIVGAQVDQLFYLKTLMNAPCGSDNCLSCSNTSVLDCYVITGSGLVVLNNNNIGNTGESLKEIDCKLMESLVNSGIFKSQSLYDFQALCTNIPKVESFANMLIDPFTKIFRLSYWLIYELFIILQNLSLSSLLWDFSSEQEISTDIPATTVASVYDGRPCFIRIPSFFTSFFSFRPDKVESPSKGNDTVRGNDTGFTNESSVVIDNPLGNNKTNSITCPTGCSKTWYAVDIENTNLILVVVHKSNPTCTCECQSTFGLKTEIKRNVSNPIENPIVQRPNYFSQFLNFTKVENSTECSDDSAMSTMPLKSMIAILVCVCFSLLLLH